MKVTLKIEAEQEIASEPGRYPSRNVVIEIEAEVPKAVTDKIVASVSGILADAHRTYLTDAAG